MSDRSGTPISSKTRRGGSKSSRRRTTAAVGYAGETAAAAGASALPWGHAFTRLAAPAVVCVIAGAAAHADGTFIVSVRDGNTGKPLSGAIVTLDETSGRELRHTVPTDDTGIATTPSLSDGNYQISVSAVGYERSAPVVLPLNGNSVRIDIALGLLKAQTREVTAAIRILDPNDTSISTTRSQQFLKQFPITEGNRQSLPLALRSVPGFVWDGLNQSHPRGDQDGKAIYINGVLMPTTPAGHISQTYSPQAFGSIKAITGNFAAEYGGQTGAVLDIQSRSPFDPSKPVTDPFRGYLDAGLSVGGFNTWDNYLDFGNSVPMFRSKQPRANGFLPSIDYALSFGQHYSSNGVEPPQKSPQTPENHYSSELAFGDIGLNLTPTLRMGLLFNFSSGRNGIADRTDDDGFLGLDPDFTDSQVGEGKHTRQKDNESSQFLTLSQTLKNDGELRLALGASKSTIATYEQNNAITDPMANQDTAWEYYANLGQTYDQYQIQGDLTLPTGRTAGGVQPHIPKFGFVYQDQRGAEGYYYAPRSEAADLFLSSVLPPGFQDSTQDGNHLSIRREGYYSAFYAQDTWHLSSLPLVVNYGLRFDTYKSNNDFIQDDVSKSAVSPRVNLAYELPSRGFFKFFGMQPTVVRLGFNRLFTQPWAQGQGLIAGTEGIQPEIANQWDFSIEHQFNLKSVAKLSLYTKSVDNLLESSLLLPGAQDGPIGTMNLGGAKLSGFEASYDYNPRLNPGLAGFATLSFSKAKPKSGAVDNLGNDVTDYLDHDQRTTLSLGVSYYLKSGMYGGLTFYYGSGLYASTDPVWGPLLGTDRPGRSSVSDLDLRLGTGPLWARHHLGVEFGIQNVFDSRSLVDLRSQFAGTRYQQGRRVTLGLTGKL